MNVLLRDEILRRVDIDQTHRLVPYEQKQSDPTWRTKLFEIDRENTAWLTETVDQYGWPTVSLVGKEASYSSWLLIQHADLDLEFQRRCLSLMQQAPANEVDPTNIAYLEDRILGSENKPLKYGTQYRRSLDGQSWILMEIEDIEHVDERRADMGLPTLAENMRQINTPEGTTISNMPRHRKQN